MRILHTADWHVGRSFHGHPTLDVLRDVLAEIPAIVKQQGVDAVLVAGDVFDSAAPSADAFTLLQDTLVAIRESGAQVIAISGNHDSAARLGFNSAFARLSGVHIVTDVGQIGTPVTLTDQDGEVDFYCLPFLEPALIRHRWPDEQLRNQADALDFAMRRVRASAAFRPHARTVVVAHTFVVGGEAQSTDSERPITSGSVDAVPVSAFDGIDYAALGHIHGRAALSEHVRYPGAILHYSFSEAHKPRGGWLVELSGDGLGAADWIDLPVPRPLIVVEGELDALLTQPQYERYREHWLSAVLTDAARPLDAMRRLQTRFPWCAQIEHRPPAYAGDGSSSYTQRVQGKSDQEVLGAFLRHVRGGAGPTAAEAELLEEVIAQRQAVVASR